MNEPRLLACQQNVPDPSLVNGAEMVAFTGLQVEPPPGVGVRVGVRVAVGLPPPGVSEQTANKKTFLDRGS